MDEKDRRILSLDGLRGVAILPVMMFHFAPVVSPLNAIDRFVFGAARAGWVGVDLFFVLSGFLITGILYDTRHARNYFRSFYARRFLRIFPLYYMSLIVLFILLPLVGSNVLGETASDWPWFWLHSSNFFVISKGFPSRYVQHFWSLAIEEQFYLIWPLVVILLSRRRLIALAAAIVVATAALRGVIDRHGAGGITNYFNTLTRADALAMGAMVALLLRDPIDARWVKRLAPWVLVVALPAAVVLLAQSTPRPPWLSWRAYEQVLGYSIIGATCAATLAWSVTSPSGSLLNRLLQHASLRFFGRYSYGLYVIHVPIDTTARALGVHFGASAPFGAMTLSLLLYAIAAGAVTVGLALVSWNLIEKRFLLLKRHFVAIAAGV